MVEQIATPMVFYRGGTSKAAFVDRRQIPVEDERDLCAWLLAVYGSPDPRQIDGIGGADPLTSKFAVVGPPTRPDADVDYTFYQVFVDEALVSKDMNCGNISSAVGPYAIEQGLRRGQGRYDDRARARHQLRPDPPHHREDPRRRTEDPRRTGDLRCARDGCAHRGRLHPHGPATHGKGLLPTGNARDRIDVEGLGTVEMSVVDLANLIVFAKAESFGLDGTESPDGISGNQDLMAKLERFRRTVGVKLGLAENLDDAERKCALSPFLALIAPPKDWTEYGSDRDHEAEECDFLAFSTLDGVVHKAYMVSGSSCTGVAALLPGTIVNEIRGKPGLEGRVRIGHPSGTIEVEAALEERDGGYAATRAALIRTARRLMDGRVYAAVDRLPWRDEAHGAHRMQVEYPGGESTLHNGVFHPA